MKTEKAIKFLKAEKLNRQQMNVIIGGKGLSGSSTAEPRDRPTVAP